MRALSDRMYKIGQVASSSAVKPRNRPTSRVRNKKSSGTVAMLRPPFSRVPFAMSSAFCCERLALKSSRSCLEIPRGWRTMRVLNVNKLFYINASLQIKKLGLCIVFNESKNIIITALDLHWHRERGVRRTLRLFRVRGRSGCCCSPQCAARRLRPSCPPRRAR